MQVHKNGDRDAEAIAEAATRPTMSLVVVKNAEQLDLQAPAPRQRASGPQSLRFDQSGTGLSDGAWHSRWHWSPYFPVALSQLMMKKQTDLSSSMISVLLEMAEDLASINDRVAALDAKIKA